MWDQASASMARGEIQLHQREVCPLVPQLHLLPMKCATDLHACREKLFHKVQLLTHAGR